MNSQFRKKLIEVALPLEAINRAASKEKSVRYGHPSTLHLWFARRPLAACRAIIFASLIDDPGNDLPASEAQKERNRLFRIIEDFVKWENIDNDQVLDRARDEVRKSLNGISPPVLDPFCGGGTIPLEAQRLGLSCIASDLNPVAVLITKAMIEIPPKVSSQPPINPDTKLTGQWRKAFGLSEDLQYYGRWMRDEAERRIGHLYPKTDKGRVVAWAWSRTVTCPNPACRAEMPLLKTFVLSNKKSKVTKWLEPEINKSSKTFSFKVRAGRPADIKKLENGTCFINEKGKRARSTFVCLVCKQGIARGEYIDIEANAGRMHFAPLATIVSTSEQTDFLSADYQEVGKYSRLVNQYFTEKQIELSIPAQECRGTFASNAQGRRYGFRTFSDYFTRRQLIALLTFTKLIEETRLKVLDDARKSDRLKVDPELYANSVATYLAFAISRSADYWSSLTPWFGGFVGHTFERQAIQMVWDFVEVNPFSESSGNWKGAIDWISRCLQTSIPASGSGFARQLDATKEVLNDSKPIICTDPPYYNNVCYSDLSDFFYVWLRLSIGKIWPELFATILTPKSEELIADSYRFGGETGAQQHFLTGLSRAFTLMHDRMNRDFPLTLYYAFKESEEEAAGEGEELVVSSTGWETMLEGLIRAGFVITGTWPMRTERGFGLKGGSNVLASSIVLVCRPRSLDAEASTRKEFISSLRKELPVALSKLKQGSIAPVDLAQSAIGPGMAIYSRYSTILEAEGTRMSVRTALQIINQELDAFLNSQDTDLDRETRFCIDWFQQHGNQKGPFGEADVLARAKNTSVGSLVNLGLVEAGGGFVKIVDRKVIPKEGKSKQMENLTVWRCTQELIRALEEGGESKAAGLINQMGAGLGETSKDLAYRMFSICEKKGLTDDALSYNNLVASWQSIRQKTGSDSLTSGQMRLEA